MPYSESLASRVRFALERRPGVQEKRMFGGVGFLFNGNMLVAIWQQSLIARLGIEAAQKALTQPFVKDFDLTGKPMKGWVMVGPEGVDLDSELAEWIERAWQFVATLPAK
jgi:TfoX/Sxy family transcriptional regulator of competence genes